ncbi:hypothetical protein OCF13_06250 [Bacillus tropicus]|nr:hypothetical protein [Bacillus tropicus]
MSVVLGGTNVPLPNNQNIGPGITVSGGNTVFTVANAGNYYISYTINITASLLVSSRITINGGALAGTINAPAVATTSFSATIITTLAAGDAISLQLFGLLAVATLSTCINDNKIKLNNNSLTFFKIRRVYTYNKKLMK